MDRVIDLGHDTARGTDLDDLGILAELLPDRLEPRRDTVTDLTEPAFGALDEVEVEGVAVRMPGRRREDPAGTVDVRTPNAAVVDRRRKVEAEATDLAHAGDTSVEGVGGIGRRPDGHLGDGRVQRVVHVHRRQADEVDVGIPQARHGDRNSRGYSIGSRGSVR